FQSARTTAVESGDRARGGTYDMTSRSFRLPLLAAGLLAAAATRAPAASIDLPLDEYLCYQAKQTKILPKFTGVEVSSKDQFEPLARRNYLAAKYVSVCNPTTAPVAGFNTSVHLVELSLKESKTFVNASKFAPLGTIYNLADRLGMVSGVTISKP